MSVGVPVMTRRCFLNALSIPSILGMVVELPGMPKRERVRYIDIRQSEGEGQHLAVPFKLESAANGATHGLSRNTLVDQHVRVTRIRFRYPHAAVAIASDIMRNA
jgi:hypothetical protein